MKFLASMEMLSEVQLQPLHRLHFIYAPKFYPRVKYATVEIHPKRKCPRKVVCIVVDCCAHSLVNVMYNHNILYL